MVNQNKNTGSKKRRGRTRLKKRTIAGTKQRLGESDGLYIFKLVTVTIISTLWLKFAVPVSLYGLTLTALPLGLMIALLGIRTFEPDAYERRIWYAVALVIGIITYFVPAGIVI